MIRRLGVWEKMREGDDIIGKDAQFVRLNSVNLHLLRGKKKVENDY